MIHVIIFQLPIDLLIFSEMRSETKISKYATLLALVYKAIQWVPVGFYLLRFATLTPSFMVLGRLFRE